MCPETFFIVSEFLHKELVEAAYKHRCYSQEDSAYAARFATYASLHGIRTHNAIKGLHLDEWFSSEGNGCDPSAEIEKLPSRFATSEIWNANRKLGQATAYAAMERCIQLADEFGIGQICVDNAFHYLWGGGYVMDAANRGYIAYTNCTAALAEVVPFMGKFPTIGTNPHSWGFPTVDAIGFPIVIDWATSVIAMGRVQQLKREGSSLPSNAAVDKEGNATTDANEVAALLPFGAHKGYGLGLINELVAGMIGGSLPTIRCRDLDNPAEKNTPCFYFQIIHPDAWSAGAFAKGRNQSENIKAVIEDVLGHGNENCLLPGQLEAEAAVKCKKNGGLLFTSAELDAFDEIADEVGAPRWDRTQFKEAE